MFNKEEKYKNLDSTRLMAISFAESENVSLNDIESLRMKLDIQ